jgi:hypothetical protein
MNNTLIEQLFHLFPVQCLNIKVEVIALQFYFCSSSPADFHWLTSEESVAHKKPYRHGSLGNLEAGQSHYTDNS